jgi:hypothetical protein
VLDELAARRLVLLADRNHWVVFASRRRAAPEDAAAHVRDRERGGILLHQFPPQGEKARRVVPVIVSEDDLFDVGEIDLQVARILQDRVGMRAGVHQHPVPVRFDEAGEPPFAKSVAIADEHGGKDGDLESTDLSLRRGLRKSAPGCGNHDRRQTSHC